MATQATAAGSGYKLMEKNWENIQRKTFTGWVNSHLKKHGRTIKDLERDLGDGLALIELLEIISGEPFPSKYEKVPNHRIKKVANIGQALRFIETKGVKLASIAPEEIVDSNLKMCLGLIWTIILRFQIQDISLEELSAKEALLLWCQRKTEGYKDVNVQNFHVSFQDGLAFCALIHRHRPDLLDFKSLNKDNKRQNLELAFDVAEKHLGVPKLLDADDIVNIAKPDERSIITYVSLYYHVFSQSQQGELAGRRIGKLVEFSEQSEHLQHDYADRAQKLRAWVEGKQGEYQSREFADSLDGVQAQMNNFQSYKKAAKAQQNDEKVSLEALYNALQTKLAVNHRAPYMPPSGLSPADIAATWLALERTEHNYSLALLAAFRRQRKIRDLLRRFENKLATLQAWMSEHQNALARRDDIVDTLSAVRAKLKNHDSFEEEKQALNVTKNDALRQIYDELQLLQYADLAALDAKLAAKDTDWAALEQTAADRKQALMQELARQQQIEDLLVDFAKRAAAFRVWANEADDQLTDPLSVDTLAGAEELQSQYASLVQDRDKQAAHVKALTELAAQLRAFDVQETHFSNVSIDDINATWTRLQQLFAARESALRDEHERQAANEQLRVEFAQQAEQFAQFVDGQSALVGSLAGTPESQSEKLSQIHLNVKNSSEQYDNLVRVTQKLEEAAVLDNPHTSHTIDSLRAAWNALATLIQEKGKALDREAAATRKSGLSPQQVHEFRECFVHFDKDKDSFLSRLELFSCLKSLGYDLPLDENGPLDALLAQIGGPNGQRVSFDGFLAYMEKLNGDVDSPDQIAQAFVTIANGKDYVLESELRQHLPADKVQYLLGHMPPVAGVPGAYDFKQFTAAAYGHGR